MNAKCGRDLSGARGKREHRVNHSLFRIRIPKLFGTGERIPYPTLRGVALSRPGHDLPQHPQQCRRHRSPRHIPPVGERHLKVRLVVVRRRPDRHQRYHLGRRTRNERLGSVPQIRHGHVPLRYRHGGIVPPRTLDHERTELLGIFPRQHQYRIPRHPRQYRPPIQPGRDDLPGVQYQKDVRRAQFLKYRVVQCSSSAVRLELQIQIIVESLGLRIHQRPQRHPVISRALDVPGPSPRGATPFRLEVQVQSPLLALEIIPGRADVEQERKFRAGMQSQLLPRPQQHRTDVQFHAVPGRGYQIGVGRDGPLDASHEQFVGGGREAHGPGAVRESRPVAIGTEY
mmetsp:Transcript_38119/g.113924  ORF Transcript_38119/g.113924 Transcript_38119/m.113924 type:complete len:342 (+) Transcript_38119:71-1096(+)